MVDLLSLLTVGPVWGGIIAGVLHAILGPDHLSTIATLSVCQGAEAFWFGVRWASGHVSGMLTIVVVLSLLSWRYPNVFETYEHYADYLIGFLLMMFGGYFLSQMDRSFDAEGNPKSGSCGCCHQADDAAEPEAGTSELSPLNPKRRSNNSIRRTSSSIMGFVQGIACPAGLVGIVFLKQYVQSLPEILLFVAVFFVVTALSMGCMAMAYGVLTKRCISSATLAYCIYVASCLVSLVLGATWIVLAASGRLELLGHDHHHHHHHHHEHEHGLPHDESLLFVLAAPR